MSNKLSLGDYLKVWPYACKTCYGTGEVITVDTFTDDDGNEAYIERHSSCPDCIGKCPRCGAEINDVHAFYKEGQPCPCCGWNHCFDDSDCPMGVNDFTAYQLMAIVEVLRDAIGREPDCIMKQVFGFKSCAECRAIVDSLASAELN